MNKRGLKSKISKKLDQLSELLDNIDEARIINADDQETWDSDALYDCLANLKEALQLLEDQPIKGATDEFGQPLTEDGLCSLVDNYQSKEDF